MTLLVAAPQLRSQAQLAHREAWVDEEGIPLVIVVLQHLSEQVEGLQLLAVLDEFPLLLLYVVAPQVFFPFLQAEMT